MESKIKNVLIIGAAKSGTTTFYNDLAKHPYIHAPKEKEPGILIRAKDEKQAIKYYKQHFSGQISGQIALEATTTYTAQPTFPDVASLAKKVLGPDTYIIYMVRDPVARIKSHLAHDIVVGRISSKDIDRLIEEDERYIAWSSYCERLQPWVSAFGTGNVTCINFEFYVKNRKLVVDNILNILGIPLQNIGAFDLVLNEKGSQSVARYKLVNGVVNSNYYRINLSKKIPKGIKKFIMPYLNRSDAVPDINLSDKVVKIINRKNSSYVSDLKRLDVHMIGFVVGDGECI